MTFLDVEHPQHLRFRHVEFCSAPLLATPFWRLLVKVALVKWPGANIWQQRRWPQLRSTRTLTDIKDTEKEVGFLGSF